MNWRKWTVNNPKVYVVNINASAKFGRTKIHSFVLKILSRNKFLMSFKVMNWRKWMLNNPKLGAVNINAFLHSQDTEQKWNSMSFKDHNSMNWQKWKLNNPKLDFVNINAYAKFGQNPPQFPQNIEQKWKCYRWMETDGQPQNSIPHSISNAKQEDAEFLYCVWQLPLQPKYECWYGEGQQ